MKDRESNDWVRARALPALGDAEIPSERVRADTALTAFGPLSGLLPSGVLLHLYLVRDIPGYRSGLFTIDLLNQSANVLDLDTDLNIRQTLQSACSS